MRRHRATAAALALALLALPAFAHEEKAPAGGGAVRQEIVGQIEDAEKKLLALADAMPADKYGWRPGEGVRSVGEAFMHVAGGNYFLPTFWGVNPPEGVNPREFEAGGGDKAKAVSTLKASFEHLKKAVQDLSDADLDKAVKMFGRDATVRQAAMVAANHAHEHLGQAIAYARMNGIAPPWSAKGGE